MFSRAIQKLHFSFRILENIYDTSTLKKSKHKHCLLVMGPTNLHKSERFLLRIFLQDARLLNLATMCKVMNMEEGVRVLMEYIVLITYFG